MSFASLWVVFSFSFVVALSGAMVPGPLLTYTIIKTIQSRRHGFLVGAWVIGGHAFLESALVAAILLGFSVVLESPMAVRVIGVIGGGFLVFMGVSLVLDIKRHRVPEPFASGEAPRADGVVSNPILGGVLISMSNPYWWIWWATIGLAFMSRYGVSFRNWPVLLAFLAGHEAGDLAWYSVVSVLVFLGRRRLNTRIYHVVLACCGVIMMGFGLYLGVSPFYT